VTLHPAFALTTRPVLPTQSGPNQLRGIAADGTVLFRLSFDGVPVEDGPAPTERHFVFFVPLARGNVDRLDRIEVSTPSGSAVLRSAAAAATRPEVQVGTGAGGRTRIRWDANAYPLMLVREAGTGQVLSIARGGEIELAAGAPGRDRLEVLLSDGVRSHVAVLR
jgi:hypothetical protein